MHYALSLTNALAEHRSSPDLMHFRKYALLPYALLHFLLLLNGGLAYGPYDVNRITLTSDPMPAALLSDPMIRLTPIFDIGVVFRI